MNFKRQVRHTVIIYCEGKTDKLFLQYLKKLYVDRGIKKITIKEKRGASRLSSNMEKIAQITGHDKKCILLDINNKKPQKIKELGEESTRNDIQLIWQEPCLEGVFLKILDKTLLKETSQKCKNIFYKKHTNQTALTTVLLEKLFTKTILNKKRKEIPELNQLIKIMEP